MEKKTKTVCLCYVCNKPVSGGDYICVSSEIFRHKRCAVGTANWLKSQAADQSDFYDMFKDRIDEARSNGNKPKTKKKTATDLWLEQNKKFKDEQQNKEIVKPPIKQRKRRRKE